MKNVIMTNGLWSHWDRGTDMEYELRGAPHMTKSLRTKKVGETIRSTAVLILTAFFI